LRFSDALEAFNDFFLPHLVGFIKPYRLLNAFPTQVSQRKDGNGQNNLDCCFHYFRIFVFVLIAQI
jgi:hypothetical protein